MKIRTVARHGSRRRPLRRLPPFAANLLWLYRCRRIARRYDGILGRTRARSSCSCVPPHAPRRSGSSRDAWPPLLARLAPFCAPKGILLNRPARRVRAGIEVPARNIVSCGMSVSALNFIQESSSTICSQRGGNYAAMQRRQTIAWRIASQPGETFVTVSLSTSRLKSDGVVCPATTS